MSRGAPTGVAFVKFSIRELFLITAIVALSLGWWLEHRQVVHMRWRFAAIRAWIGLVDMKGEAYPLELYEDVPREIDER